MRWLDAIGFPADSERLSRCGWRRRGSALLLTAAVLGGAASDSTVRDPVQDRIRDLLLERPTDVVVAGVELLQTEEVRRFYGDRRYARAWSGSHGAASRGEALRAVLRSAAVEGLDPERYHARALDRLTRAGGASDSLNAVLDVVLTDAFLAFARDLALGRVDARTAHPAWAGEARHIDGVAALRGIARGEPPLVAIEPLRPPYDEYVRLRSALARYRGLERAGGWVAMPAVRLALGDAGDEVVLLRARLSAESGRLPSRSPLFDAALDTAVRAFQWSHGLEVDGIVGPQTRRTLDVPVAARIQQIAMALERWRWMPEPDGELRIEISIPAFTLDVIEGDTAVLSMRIIAGRRDWPTPIFGATIRSAILSPYWNVPARIAALEVLPAVRRDRSYLARNHMQVLTKSGRVVDPTLLDFSAPFPHRIRQVPGPDNPLGGIKFVLPNPYDVYLHDTSAPALFARAGRALSHGCIRLERPLDLAALLLRDRPEWTRQALVDAIATWKQREVTLPAGVPVAIRYRTAWVEPDGKVHFRDDLYGHDARLVALLVGARTAVAHEPAEPPAGCSVEAAASQ